MRRTTPEGDDFHFDLEANAEDSLSHGVDHFIEAQESGDPSHLKYTILHTFHATELYLKARLAKAHPSLIFQKPEEAHKHDPKTVDFDTLIGRLAAASVQLDEEEHEDLKQLRIVRNRIEHHKISFSLEQAQNYVGKAMRFLEQFLEEELSISLKDNLDKDKYIALQKAVYSYEERLERAKESANETGPVDYDGSDWNLLECPECGEETLSPTPEKDGDCRCYFCNSRATITYCPRCGGPRINEDEDSYVECDDCVDYRMSKDD